MLRAELELAEWRGLLALADWPAPEVRRAADAALDARRGAMRHALERLFVLLEIKSRIALEALVDLAVAVVNGLAVGRESDSDPGPALDALVMAFYKLGD